MILIGAFIIFFELFPCPGGIKYFQFHKHIIGRGVFFVLLGCLCYVPSNDVLHFICMLIILAVGFFLIFWGILGCCQGSSSMGTPPALTGRNGGNSSGSRTQTRTTTKTTTRTTTTNNYVAMEK